MGKDEGRAGALVAGAVSPLGGGDGARGRLGQGRRCGAVCGGRGPFFPAEQRGRRGSTGGPRARPARQYPPHRALPVMFHFEK